MSNFAVGEEKDNLFVKEYHAKDVCQLFFLLVFCKKEVYKYVHLINFLELK